MDRASLWVGGASYVSRKTRREMVKLATLAEARKIFARDARTLQASTVVVDWDLSRLAVLVELVLDSLTHVQWVSGVWT